ncbi:hypothetical protein KUTeg_018700 [Tegillarca granosa]|uniref:Caspase-8 n=1 Tax=Tegillarca granosa TaxID=220873 RepID=A0ABQ9EJM0_TEGGR|nr:hypothetical protein KUTeg_018700 [Tegillarca granosa]
MNLRYLECLLNEVFPNSWFVTTKTVFPLTRVDELIIDSEFINTKIWDHFICIEMSDNWKNGIVNNLRMFKRNLAKPETVVDHLFSDGILTAEMKEDIMQFHDEPEKLTDRMLTILLRRGPKALPALHRALIDDNSYLAELIQPYVEELQRELEIKEAKFHPSEWPPTTEEHDRMKNDKVTLSDIDIMKSKYNSRATYPMKNRVRGRVLIINNIHFLGKAKNTGKSLSYRDGSAHDEELITDLFSQLHFIIVTHGDKTADEMRQIVEKEKSNPDHVNADCFICVIMSHGCHEGIYGVDGDVINLETLSSRFDPKNCPALNEKPKLFFVQACRGEDGVENKRDGDDVDSLKAGFSKIQLDSEMSNNPIITGVPTVHSAADFLTAYATPPENSKQKY